MPAKAIDFEAWAASRGASRFAFAEAGMHARGHGSDAKWQRELRRLADEMKEHEVRRNELRAEYDRLVAEGELRPLNRRERLELTALGNPELLSVQAAKRLLQKELERSGEKG